MAIKQDNSWIFAVMNTINIGLRNVSLTFLVFFAIINRYVIYLSRRYIVAIIIFTTSIQLQELTIWLNFENSF